MRLKMCTRCLSIGYTVHSSQDCDEEEVHNPGLKLAFSAESPNLLRLIKEIEETEEEICPVCKKDTCEDPYVCLKEAKFMVVGDDFQIEPGQ